MNYQLKTINQETNHSDGIITNIQKWDNHTRNQLGISYLLTYFIPIVESYSHDIPEPRNEPPKESIITIMISYINISH